MPADKLRDDLPTYQESALGRWLTQVLTTRAAMRREAHEAEPRRGLRVRAKQPRRGTQPAREPSPSTSTTKANHDTQEPAAIRGEAAGTQAPKVTGAQQRARQTERRRP